MCTLAGDELLLPVPGVGGRLSPCSPEQEAQLPPLLKTILMGYGLDLSYRDLHRALGRTMVPPWMPNTWYLGPVVIGRLPPLRPWREPRTCKAKCHRHHGYLLQVVPVACTLLRVRALQKVCGFSMTSQMTRVSLVLSRSVCVAEWINFLLSEPA